MDENTITPKLSKKVEMTTEVVIPQSKNEIQYKIILNNDYELCFVDNNVIYKSDYDLMLHDVDNDYDTLIIRYINNKDIQSNFIDIYFYEKEKMIEQRGIYNFRNIQEFFYEKDHKNGKSTLSICFDTNCFLMKNCPIEFFHFLSDLFFYKKN